MLLARLGEHLCDEPSAVALLAQDGTKFSRQRLAVAIGATSALLADQGFARPDRLALLMDPGPSMVAALIGAMSVGAVAPLVPSSPAAVLVEDLHRLACTGVLVDAEPGAAILEASETLGLPVVRLDPFCLPDPSAVSWPVPDAASLALLLQTSGTTSRPKVVPLSHANLLASALSVAEVLRLGPADRSLAAMPLFHIHGLVASLLAPLLAGGSVICASSNRPEALLDAMVGLHATWLSAVPTLLQGLITEQERRGVRPPEHCLRLLRSSSSSLPPSLLARLEAMFQVPVIEAYGMTEAAHQICSNRLPDSGPDRQPGCVGPSAGPEVVVLGADRLQVTIGTTGEVAIRGANVTAGYEASEQSGWIEDPSGERWFLTGDEGFLDTEGRLTLTGRLKEMINRGGKKVIPRRVDEALLQHPAVQQAVAFAVSHPTLGEDVVAAVVLQQGANAEEQDLRLHALGLLHPHEVPSRIVFLPDLPRGATGKLQRIGLASKITSLLPHVSEPACGELEAMVAHAFADVLRQMPPARSANFFMLGGDSLSGQRVIISLEAQLNLKLNPTLLFYFPTVQSLAEKIDQLLEEALAPPV